MQEDDTFFEFQVERKFPMNGEYHNKLIGEVNNGNALDIGAHVGIWSRQLIKKFNKVYAWEPILSSCECLKKNVPDVTIFPFAAASKQGKSMAKPDKKGNYGGYFLNQDGDQEVIKKVIDDFDFKDISFIQLHVKGMEYDALCGMEKTLSSYKPKIVYQAYSDQLEKFGHVEDDIELFLKSWGYTIESSDLFKSWGITYKVAHI